MQKLNPTAHPAAWNPTPATSVSDPLDLLAASAGTVNLARERELYGQGDPVEYCYRIVSGCLRTVKLMEDGRRQVAAFFFPGDCLAFDQFDSHDFAAQAVTDAVVRRYRRREVEALADRHPLLARRLRELSARSLRTAHDRMLLLGRKTASERIASFLLEMSGRQGSTHSIALPMSRIDIADHLGLTVETVCRMLAHLRRDGTITVAPGGVTLRHHLALRQMAADLRH
jgi:CRP/FNR family nitrogen fixation transcriptional regulator